MELGFGAAVVPQFGSSRERPLPSERPQRCRVVGSGSGRVGQCGHDTFSAQAQVVEMLFYSGEFLASCDEGFE